MLLTHTRMTESTWTLPAVSLLMVGMLVAFYAVVSSATKAGELRRQATATQTAAAMRCNALPGWDASKTCLKKLAAPAVPADEPILLAAQ